jgi:hypothetical protein
MPGPLRRSNRDFADRCIYTIRHSEAIEKFSQSAGPHTIDTKQKPWTTAKKLVEDARKQNEIVPLLFAPAEDTTNIVAYANLLSVKTGSINTCTFENVRYLSPPIRKTTLKKRDGTKLNIDFIREYAVCKTPLLKFTNIQRTESSALGRSSSAASEIVRRLDLKGHSKAVLKAVADSIQAAHQIAPSKWGIRLNQNRNDIMLKVGMVEVLQLGGGWFHHLVRSDLVPKKLRSDRRFGFGNSPPYKNAPRCIACDIAVSLVSQAYPALLPAHEAAIQIAARSGRHPSTTRDHSPGLIVFLSRELNELLPQPAYYENFHQAEVCIPEEIPNDEQFKEGAVVQVLVNRYERDPTAREKCIKHYGTKCVVCSMSLADRYGPTVSGLIHVHHLTPLASIGKPSTIDPIRDLRPVCPNCHAVIHSTRPPLTIEQVRKMFGAKP